MSKHCSSCDRAATSRCWNSHLGWCPVHKITFPSERDPPGAEEGTACATCLNEEWEATEAHSRIQGDAAVAAQALKRAQSKLAWSLKSDGESVATPDTQLLLEIDYAQNALNKCESQRRAAYQRQNDAIAARRASQKRMAG